MGEAKNNNVRVGVAGWSYKDWDGPVYPADKPKKFDQLAFVASYVDTIEINSTFYHPGPRKNAESWARRTEEFENFRFTVKLWQKFTHEDGDFGEEEVDMARTVPEVLDDAGKLGAVLAQFPWSFKNEEKSRELMNRVLDAFSDFPLAVEVRHDSWDTEPFYKMLEEHNVAFVNLDQPLIGHTLKAVGHRTAKLCYCRFHGRNYENWFRDDAGRDDRYDYLYSGEELGPWKERVEKMSEECGEVYVIANNHYKGQSMANALQFKFMLGHEVEVPDTVGETFPEIASMIEK